MTVLNGQCRGCLAYLRASILLLSLLLGLAGCGILPFPTTAETTPDRPAAHDLRIARVLADEGLRKISQYRYEDASRIFNAGLKFAPSDARLHFLNALAYHLLFLRGNEAMKDPGAAGYELALNFDPAHYYAALQLGRLQFEAKRYGESANAFRRAIDIQPKSGAAHIGLASANYYAHDLVGARAAAEKAASLLPDDADAMRALAMIYAALGEHAKAGDASIGYATLEQDAYARTRLNARIDQWRSWHEMLVELDSASKRAPLAQVSPAEGSRTPPVLPGSRPGESLLPPRSRQEVPGSSNAERRAGSSTGRAIPGSAADQQAGTDQTLLRSWFECGDSRSEPLQPAIGGSIAIDDLVPMPRLPSPCAGAGSPNMVVLDIVFIRTDNSASSSHGINLLELMTYVLGFAGSRRVVDQVTQATGAPDTRTVTITRERASGFPAAGILYSMNIANSTDNRTEILARPSLVALDRMPSTFFSGRNVTLGIQGTAGSASSITDRPIGISLSVTPTFIDAETMLLAVRAQRSFVEAVNPNVIFGSTLQMSRNVVSANVMLKMGQTLILSGLSEREIQRATDGVPVLKDIPVLQYLFNKDVTADFTTSVLVLITPRPPATDQELLSKTVGHVDTLSDPAKRRFGPLIEKAMKARPESVPGNLEGTYGHVLGNTLFLQFRTGDLTVEHWSEPPRLLQFFKQLRELLYY